MSANSDPARRGAPAARGGEEGRGSGRLRTIVAEASAQLTELTGRPTNSVISVEHVDGMWRMSVELVEVERIPSSTSILGVYDVTADEDGNLVDYTRTARYHRNQAGGGE